MVIVHGTFGDQKSLLDKVSRAMVHDGFCVYALDYGNRATRTIEDSAAELYTFVEQGALARREPPRSRWWATPKVA